MTAKATLNRMQVITLGTLSIVNPEEGDVPFLSAASGVVWSGPRLYSVGDDQAALAEFVLDSFQLLEALREGASRDILRPGVARRIIPDVLPLDPMARKEAKADFEALTIVRPDRIDTIPADDVRVETRRRFPHGLLLVAGSGGVSWGGVRRSIGVAYSLDEEGHIVGLPAKFSLEGLHEYLEKHVVIGELNVEGLCVHGQHLVLAQRGNSLDQEGNPAPNMLIRLSLTEVMRSLYTDLKIDQCELEEVRSYDIGYLPLDKGEQSFDVKLDFTDVASVTADPLGRLVFTAAAEGTGDPVEGEIAGSVVGVIGPEGNIDRMVPLADSTIKLEGVDARYNPALGSIDLLLVSDADDPGVPAPVMAARIPWEGARA
ncbi:MAG TPA: hypothetical protein VHG90_01915 [Acidimicrobiales bacterium]|nr:hypothetical protein [Acidimicrobiales bacterium]